MAIEDFLDRARQRVSARRDRFADPILGARDAFMAQNLSGVADARRRAEEQRRRSIEARVDFLDESLGLSDTQRDLLRNTLATSPSNQPVSDRPQWEEHEMLRGTGLAGAQHEALRSGMMGTGLGGMAVPLSRPIGRIPTERDVERINAAEMIAARQGKSFERPGPVPGGARPELGVGDTAPLTRDQELLAGLRPGQLRRLKRRADRRAGVAGGSGVEADSRNLTDSQRPFVEFLKAPLYARGYLQRPEDKQYGQDVERLISSLSPRDQAYVRALTPSGRDTYLRSVLSPKEIGTPSKTTDIQNYQFYTNDAKARGVSPKDILSFREYSNASASAKQEVMNVTVGGEGGDEAMQERLFSDYNKVEDEWFLQQNTRTRYQEMEALLDAGLKTGWGEDLKFRARKVLSAFGQELGPQFSMQEFFTAMTNAIAIPRAKELGVNPTDRDMEMIMDSILSGKKTEESNRLLIAVQKLRLDRSEFLAKEMNQFMLDNQGAPAYETRLNWSSRLREIVGTNELWTEAGPKLIEEARRIFDETSINTRDAAESFRVTE